MSTLAGEPVLQQITRELTFVGQGLLGFESLLRYELSVYDPETPFYWLRSLDDPDVAFIVMEPGWLLEDYSFDLNEEDARLLGAQSDQDVFVLVLCTVPEDPLAMTANLLGPLVFHRDTNQGRQLILDRHRYPVRYPIFQDAVEDATELTDVTEAGREET